VPSLQNTPNFTTNYSFNHTIFQVSTEILLVPTLHYYILPATLAILAIPTLKFHLSGFTADFWWPQLLLETCSCRITFYWCNYFSTE